MREKKTLPLGLKTTHLALVFFMQSFSHVPLIPSLRERTWSQPAPGASAKPEALPPNSPGFTFVPTLSPYIVTLGCTVTS